MNPLKENMMIGLLVALVIGPSLTANPNLSLAVRLSSISLLATGTGGRVVSELRSQLAQPYVSRHVNHLEDSEQVSETDAA